MKRFGTVLIGITAVLCGVGGAFAHPIFVPFTLIFGAVVGYRLPHWNDHVA